MSKIAGGFLAANVVAGAGEKVLGFIGDSVSAASNLQQAVGGVESVFKDNAATILDWGKNNAANFGLSQRAFNEMAGPLGAMLKNTGMDMSQVSGKTIDLTKRAADMAATFGGDATEALTAISAALRGETDPIERYGVSMSAAKVEARAMADTGKTVASSLTDQEKAAARLALLFEQTADAEGQSAREADSHAGATARATAKMEDMQAQIGAKLLPITVKLTEVKLALINAIVTKVIPALEELYARHWPAVQRAIDSVISFVQQHWPIFQAVIQTWWEFTKTRIEGFIEMAKAIVEVVTSVVNLVSALFRGDWSRAWQEMKDIAEAIVDYLIGFIKAQFGSIPEILLGLAGDAGRAAIQFGKSIFDGIVGFVEKIPGEVRSAMNSAIDWVNGLINGVSGTEIVPTIKVAGRTVVPGVSLPNLPNIPRLKSGLGYVPYDFYPALLDRGERVLTAEENRRGAGQPVINVIVQNNGTLVGQENITRWIGAAWMEAYRGGAFYGVRL